MNRARRPLAELPEYVQMSRRGQGLRGIADHESPVPFVAQRHHDRQHDLVGAERLHQSIRYFRGSYVFSPAVAVDSQWFFGVMNLQNPVSIGDDLQIGVRTRVVKFL